jgi:hypothetical protein
MFANEEKPERGFQMSADQFSKLIALLERLDAAKIPYTMEHSRYDAIMIIAFAPGEYWEIEFMEDGEMDIERYRSNGKVYDQDILEELFRLCSDEESPAEPERSQDDSVARK